MQSLGNHRFYSYLQKKKKKKAFFSYCDWAIKGYIFNNITKNNTYIKHLTLNEPVY